MYKWTLYHGIGFNLGYMLLFGAISLCIIYSVDFIYKKFKRKQK